MKNIKYITLTLFVSLLFNSCNDEVNNSINEFDSDKNINEFGFEFLSNGKTIRFVDENSYFNLLDIIAKKNEQEKKDFFEELSIKSQYVLLNEADEELVSICETSNDQHSFITKYADFLEKYDGIFMFNEVDDEDLCAYSKVISVENRYFADENGLFYIGDSLVSSPLFESVAEYLDLTVNTRSTSYLDVFNPNHAWSHQSDRKVGLYISINGERVTVNFTSQKKGIFGWVRYNTVYYAKFIISNFAWLQNGEYVSKSNIPFQVETPEMGGNVSFLLGRAYLLPPSATASSVSSYFVAGTMEVWSRGVLYEKRGLSRVALSSR